MTGSDIVVAVALAWVNRNYSLGHLVATAAICARLDLDPDQLVESGELIEVLIALKATILADAPDVWALNLDARAVSDRWKAICRHGNGYHQKLWWGWPKNPLRGT